MLLTLLTTRQSTWSPPFLAYSRFMYRSLLFCPLQSKNAPSPWLVERIVIIKEDEDPSPVALARGELLVAMRPCFYLVLPSSRSGRRRRMCRRLHRQDYSSASNDLLLCRWLPPHIYIYVLVVSPLSLPLYSVAGKSGKTLVHVITLCCRPSLFFYYPLTRLDAHTTTTGESLIRIYSSFWIIMNFSAVSLSLCRVV